MVGAAVPVDRRCEMIHQIVEARVMAKSPLFAPCQHERCAKESPRREMKALRHDGIQGGPGVDRAPIATVTTAATRFSRFQTP
jgi:hypothetical protein